MSDEILVIGGGFAGLAAGVALAEGGARVRLLEARPYLGGRARSWVDPATGSMVDNGQHLFMGCYHATLHFLHTIGSLHQVKFQDALRLLFLDRGGHLTSLECPNLPAPFHVLLGLARSGSFTRREKLEVFRLGWALRGSTAQPNGAGQFTVDEWLARCGQSESLRRNFWHLLCIAAMNEDPQIASAALFERVLRLALFTSAADSRLGIAAAGLSECYTRQAADYISARGGTVGLEQPVRRLIIRRGECQGVELLSGQMMNTGLVISAVPWFALAQILSADLQDGSFFAGLSSLQPVPIISINLWLDRPVTDLDFAGLRGTSIQWLFNRGKLLENAENYISLVISGAHRHVDRSKHELQNMALDELGELIPGVRQARVLRSLVVKERYATFSPTSEAEALRPPSRTPVKGLYLAGDWTATSLPATIEGAVRSGYDAAGAAGYPIAWKDRKHNPQLLKNS